MSASRSIGGRHVVSNVRTCSHVSPSSRETAELSRPRWRPLRVSSGLTLFHAQMISPARPVFFVYSFSGTRLIRAVEMLAGSGVGSG